MSAFDLLHGRRQGNEVDRADDRKECERVQAILLDLADRRATSPDAHAAVAHLERCRDCEAELASTSLILTALRRLADEVDSATPSNTSWRQVAAKIQTSPPPRIRVGNIAGAIVGVALVVTIALPPILSLSYANPQMTVDANGPTVVVPDTGQEERHAAPAFRGLSYDRQDLLAAPQGSMPALYPDNNRPAPGGGSGAQG